MSVRGLECWQFDLSLVLFISHQLLLKSSLHIMENLITFQSLDVNQHSEVELDNILQVLKKETQVSVSIVKSLSHRDS